jgi:hypothetical protein
MTQALYAHMNNKRKKIKNKKKAKKTEKGASLLTTMKHFVPHDIEKFF